MRQTCLVSTLESEICGLLYRTPAVRRRAETPHGRQYADHHEPIEADGSEPATASALGNTRGCLSCVWITVRKGSARPQRTRAAASVRAAITIASTSNADASRNGAPDNFKGA